MTNIVRPCSGPCNANGWWRQAGPGVRYGTSQATVPQRVAVQTSRDLTHLRPDGLPGSRSSFARHAEPPLAEAARDLSTQAGSPARRP
jgi:hypothetical protein